MSPDQVELCSTYITTTYMFTPTTHDLPSMSRPVIRIARDQLPAGCMITTSSCSPFLPSADHHQRDAVSSEDEQESLRHCLPQLDSPPVDMSADPPAAAAAAVSAAVSTVSTSDSGASSVAAAPAFVFSSAPPTAYVSHAEFSTQKQFSNDYINYLLDRLTGAEAGLVAARAAAALQAARIDRLERTVAAAAVQHAGLSEQQANSPACSAASLVPPPLPQPAPMQQQQQQPQQRRSRLRRSVPAASPLQAPMHAPMQPPMHASMQQPSCPQQQHPPQQQQHPPQQQPPAAHPQQSRPQRPQHTPRPNRQHPTFASVTAGVRAPSRLPHPRAATFLSSLPYRRSFALRGVQGHPYTHEVFQAAKGPQVIRDGIHGFLCVQLGGLLVTVVDAYIVGPPTNTAVHFTVATSSDAALIVSRRCALKGKGMSILELLSPEEHVEHARLWPQFQQARLAGKRAQFHRARLVIDGERVA